MKAQGSVEFAATLGIFVSMFLILFTVLSSSYTLTQTQTDSARLDVIANGIKSQITQSLSSVDGYRLQFDPLANVDQENYNVEFSSGNTEFVITDLVSGRRSIVFLDEQTQSRGDLCAGQIEVMSSSDYGPAFCCESCDKYIDPGVGWYYPGTPDVFAECKKEDYDYWFMCNSQDIDTRDPDLSTITVELESGDHLEQIRMRCPFGTVSAELRIPSDPYWPGTIATENIDIRYGYVWAIFEIDVDPVASLNRPLRAVCFDSAGAPTPSNGQIRI